MVNLEFIERFELAYKKNPRSRIFAPLAEAYRKMGLLDDAHRLCLRGVQIHPEFAGGRVAFAKVLIDMGEDETALTQLEKAVDVSPENILAHNLIGEALIRLRRPKEALKAYKMVLFLSPNDEKARQTVQKWEFLSADDYEDELFAMKPVFRMKDRPDLPPEESDLPTPPPILQPVNLNPQKARALERAASLADAFTIRGDFERAVEVLVQARQQIGSTSEIERRLHLLAKRVQELSLNFENLKAGHNRKLATHIEGPSPSDPNMNQAYRLNPKEKKRQKLETFLRRIEARRFGG